MTTPSTSKLPFLLQPVPIYTLVWLRIAVGLLAAFDILGNGIYYHWYCGELDAANFQFSYFGFEWVKPFPEPFLSLYFILGFFVGLAVAVGWRFKYTAPTLALAIAYLFLIEKAHYLNHAYLFIWICSILAFTPAWREFSFDVRRNPSDWTPTTPRWTLWIFPLLMAIVYFYGAIAKINSDWLLRGIPLRMWLEARADLPIIGPIISLDWVGFGMAWGGFLLDLLAPFMLLGRRSRWWILGFIFFFHIMNHFIFNIGIFPYLSLVMTSLFFDPDWPVQAVKWVGKRVPVVARWRERWLSVIPGSDTLDEGKKAGAALDSDGEYRVAIWQAFPSNARPIYITLGILIFVHCTLPFRHHLFGPNVAWTEEGHRYSWRMMLRTKSGHGYFQLVDSDTGESWQVFPEQELFRRQARKMYTHPDMILDFAHHLAREEAANGRDVEVYAHISVRLNDGDYGIFVDPEVDLSKTEWSWFSHKEWVMPPPQKD
ncbi:MAG: HTTM domain-containing protein [Bacteroidota bacterium]